MPLPQLSPRRPESHKGDYGRGLLIGGAQGMAGAISLAGMATLRAGAGLVTIATPDVCQSTVAAFEPSYMTLGLANDGEGRLAKTAHRPLVEAAAKSTAVGCGPGLGRSHDLVKLVERLYFELPQPTVFDADGLNALAEQPDILNRAAGPRILTPHPGEFGRLVAKDGPMSVAERRERAIDLAVRCNAVVVLKGHQTFITDGTRSEVNTTGNAGMATGGTGDILTGVLVALLCQGLAPFDAAHLGVYVHGLAGDLAAAELGQVSMIARDLLDFLPAAFKSLGGTPEV
ncbi:MAG: NAD(P)H-hydrate dehydratase [Pirellulales bacterium]